jgi:hypothetical protein
MTADLLPYGTNAHAEDHREHHERDRELPIGAKPRPAPTGSPLLAVTSRPGGRAVR